MHFSKDERVAVLVDGANLHHATRTLGFAIDFKALLTLFRTRCHLVRVAYFTAVHDDPDEPSSIRPLLDWLEYNGFAMVTKPTKRLVDADGNVRFKGNMDVEIALSAMTLIGRVDHVVLVSGDGDFAYLAAALQQKGIRVSTISTIASRPAMIADELRRQVDQFIDLTDLEPLIERSEAPQARVRSSKADASG